MLPTYAAVVAARRSKAAFVVTLDAIECQNDVPLRSLLVVK